jgi:hypothetical protein
MNEHAAIAVSVVKAKHFRLVHAPVSKQNLNINIEVMF